MGKRVEAGHGQISAGLSASFRSLSDGVNFWLAASSGLNFVEQKMDPHVHH